jgi:hypothetical protein
MFDPHFNFAFSSVAVAPSPAISGLTLSVDSGDGALFPQPSSDGAFNLVIADPSQDPSVESAEIIRCTGRVGDDLTIARAQEGSSARAIAVGDRVIASITAKSLHDIENSLFSPDIFRPNLVSSVHPFLYNVAGGTGLINRLITTRVVVPKDGILHDLSICTVNSSGNLIGGVYDVGDTSPGVYTALFQGVSVPSVLGWVPLGDPNIPVTKGQQLVFAIMADNTTITYARVNGVSQPLVTLPAGFWPSPNGMLPKLQWIFNAPSFAMPASIPEANVLTNVTAQFPSLIARVG